MLLALAASTFFLLMLAGVYLAFKRENRSFAFIALAAAIAFGFALGSALQDGRLATRLALSVQEAERLRGENESLSERLAALEPAALVLPIAPQGADPPANIPTETAVLSVQPLPDPRSEVALAAGEGDNVAVEAAGASGIELPDAAAPEDARSSAEPAPIAEGLPATQPMPVPTLATPSSDAPVGRSQTDPVSPGTVPSGEWFMRTTTQATDVPAFRGLELTFALQLEATPDGLSGQGVKVAERLPGQPARAYAAGQGTPISLRGSFDLDGLLRVSFTEFGASRSSAGEMLLRVVADGVLEGSFASDAGNAAGTVVLERRVLVAD